MAIEPGWGYIRIVAPGTVWNTRNARNIKNSGTAGILGTVSGDIKNTKNTGSTKNNRSSGITIRNNWNTGNYWNTGNPKNVRNSGNTRNAEYIKLYTICLFILFLGMYTMQEWLGTIMSRHATAQSHSITKHQTSSHWYVQSSPLEIEENPAPCPRCPPSPQTFCKSQKQ